VVYPHSSTGVYTWRLTVTVRAMAVKLSPSTRWWVPLVNALVLDNVCEYRHKSYWETQFFGLHFRYRARLSLITSFLPMHEMQTRSCDENSICLSVCQMRELWQNGREICFDFYTIRKIIYPSFLRKRMVGGGRPHLPEILGQLTSVGAKSPIFEQIITRNAV